MLFNSLEFLIFLPIVVGLYFLTPAKYRWAILLAGSYYFYMAWKPAYIILIIFSTLVDYLASLLMSKTKDMKKRRAYLGLSLATNLGLLFLFKYYNFFAGSVDSVLSLLNIESVIPKFKLLLPMGISFYTFQTLSYTIDVYRGDIEAEKHLGIFALYVTFFPQLVAGPIERSDSLLPQFYENHKFDYKMAGSGLRLMALGMFKKVLIADNLATSVNLIYNNVTSYRGMALVYGTLLFSLQIYCDFSGYSDIARGTARLMGFRLMENFKRPYLARSIGDFWRRWHISLSTWFRDYVYIPLGGNRVKKPRAYLNLFTTFMVSGLWHGASWTFVIWGAYHGILQVLSKMTLGLRKNLTRALRLDRLNFILNPLRLLLNYILVGLGWIFFRANSLGDAKYILRNIFPLDLEVFLKEIYNLGLNELEFKVGFIAVAFLLVLSLIEEYLMPLEDLLKKLKGPVRFLVYYLLLMAILLFGNFGSQEFIYFQF